MNLVCFALKNANYKAVNLNADIIPTQNIRTDTPFGLARSPPHHDSINTPQPENMQITTTAITQLILCDEDFKDGHLPDIHNKGFNRKEKCQDSWKKN